MINLLAFALLGTQSALPRFIVEKLPDPTSEMAGGLRYGPKGLVKGDIVCMEAVQELNRQKVYTYLMYENGHFWKLPKKGVAGDVVRVTTVTRQGDPIAIVVRPDGRQGMAKWDGVDWKLVSPPDAVSADQYAENQFGDSICTTLDKAGKYHAIYKSSRKVVDLSKVAKHEVTGLDIYDDGSELVLLDGFRIWREGRQEKTIGWTDGSRFGSAQSQVVYTGGIGANFFVATKQPDGNSYLYNGATSTLYGPKEMPFYARCCGHANWIVGRSQVGSEFHAFLWTPKQVFDLNSLALGGGRPTLQDAFCVGPNGDIVATDGHRGWYLLHIKKDD